MQQFTAIQAETLKLVRDLSDTELAARWESENERPVAQRIAGDTYLHYLEHRRWLKEMLG